MKTKGIPAVVMLLAGFVTCIIGIVQHMETDVFIKTLLAVLIIFYLLQLSLKLTTYCKLICYLLSLQLSLLHIKLFCF